MWLLFGICYILWAPKKQESGCRSGPTGFIYILLIKYIYIYILEDSTYRKQQSFHWTNQCHQPGSRGRDLCISVFLSKWINRVFFLLSDGFRGSCAPAAPLCRPDNDSLTSRRVCELPQRRHPSHPQPLSRCPLAEAEALTRQPQVFPSAPGLAVRMPGRGGGWRTGI